MTNPKFGVYIMYICVYVELYDQIVTHMRYGGKID